MSYTYLYDSLGNKLKQTVNDLDSGVRITRWIYDSSGNLIQKVSPGEYDSLEDGLITDINGIAIQDIYSDTEAGIRYIYDSLTGKLLKTIVGEYEIISDEGNVTEVKVSGNTLASYVYTEDENNLLSSVTYANETVISYVYDTEGNLISMSINDVLRYTYLYDEESNLLSKHDKAENVTTTYVSNEDGSTTVTITNDNTQEVIYTYTISEDSKVFTDTVDGTSFGRTTNIDDTSDSFTYNDLEVYVKSFISDSDDNITEESISDINGTILTTRYTYSTDGKIIKIENITSKGTNEITYDYDYYGNIEYVTINGVTTYHYYYDIKDELIRVDDAENNMTVTYSYDGSGNILLKSVYEYTTESLDGLTPVDTTIYLYENSDFKDQLTSYNGMIIEYDALGNPLSYLGWTMSWVDGRRLSEMSDGTTYISFKYDEAGIRTSKTVNGVTTTYTTINGQITSQNDGTNLLYFRYDKNGNITGINVNGTEYLYVKNAQGDVIEIIDMEGNSVVYYSYDAWGKVESISGSLATTLGVLNPMRYRGYYEDTETGLYYLQSRYYDAEVGRFVSVDEPSILSNSQVDEHSENLENPFSYCNNNPINYQDPTGYIAIVDDLLFWGLIALALVAWTYLVTPQFQESWRSLCNQVGDSFSWILSKAVQMNTKAALKAAAKIRLTITKNSKNKYWTATIKKGYVDIGRAINYSQAVKEVKAGRNVFTVFSYQAIAVARAAGGNNNKKLFPEIDKGKDYVLGYYWHYHTYNRKGGHVFYLF